MHPPNLLQEPIVTSVDIRKLEAHAYPDTVPFQSTVELLAHASAEFRDRPALIFAETDEIDRPPLTWSFAELWQDVRRAGNLFRKLGVERDQPVALLVPHIPSAHVALWGAQLAGCASPINYLLQPDHIAHLLATTGTRVRAGWRAAPWTIRNERMFRGIAQRAYRLRVYTGPASGISVAPAREIASKRWRTMPTI